MRLLQQVAFKMSLYIYHSAVFKKENNKIKEVPRDVIDNMFQKKWKIETWFFSAAFLTNP